VALPPLEALLDALAEALGLGVDVKDLRVELQTLDGARVAATKSFDQAAPAVCVAPAATAAGVFLDAVVGGRAVAHHAAERAALKELLQVVGVRARGVQEAR